MWPFCTQPADLKWRVNANGVSPAFIGTHTDRVTVSRGLRVAKGNNGTIYRLAFHHFRNLCLRVICDKFFKNVLVFTGKPHLKAAFSAQNASESDRSCLKCERLLEQRKTETDFDANCGQKIAVSLEKEQNFTPAPKHQHMFHCCLMGWLILFAYSGGCN